MRHSLRQGKGATWSSAFALLFLFSIVAVTFNLNKTPLGENEPWRNSINIEISEFLSEFNDSFSNLLKSQSYESVTRNLALMILKMPDVPSCDYVEANSLIVSNNNIILEFLYVYKNFANSIKNEYSILIPYIKESDIRKIISVLSEGDNLLFVCSLLEDYKKLRSDALLVLQGNNVYNSKFYEDLFKLSIGVIFLKESVSYKISYRVIGTIFSKTGVYKIVLEYGGRTALKVVMSIAHWEIRKHLDEFIDKFPDLLNELIERISDNDYDWIINKLKLV